MEFPIFKIAASVSLTIFMTLMLFFTIFAMAYIINIAAYKLYQSIKKTWKQDK